jgi:hypothetical protein
MMDLIGLGTPYAATHIFYDYTLMANELGQAAKVVCCPSDDRTPNTNFYPSSADMPNQLIYGVPSSYGTFNNTNCSYWVGPGANDTYPQSLLGGDRNLGGLGATGSSQDQNYGFSPQPGTSTGSDVTLNTNGNMISATPNNSNPANGLVGFSAKLHSAGNTAGAGNILLGDGSVQQVTSGNFRLSWLKNGQDVDSTNSGVASVTVHLVFP